MNVLISRWRSIMAAVPKGDDWSTPDPPATDAEISEAEKAIGRSFPELLVSLWQCSRSWLWREKGFDAVIFNPPKELVSEFFAPSDPMDRVSVSTSLSSRVKETFYSKGRLTIAFSDYYRFQIDDDPTPDGVPGQIVVIDTESESIDVIAESLEEFVSHGLDCLELQIAGGYPRED